MKCQTPVDNYKDKTDKIVTIHFPKFVSFQNSSVQEELRISEQFFATLVTNRKESLTTEREFFIFIKIGKGKKISKSQDRSFSAENKRFVSNYNLSEIEKLTAFK